MAISTTTWHSARASGSNDNGGAFNPGNGNFPTDGTATSATGSAPVFSSVSYTFGASDVGAWLFIKSGTNWLPGWYQITSVAAGAATLNAAASASRNYASGAAGYSRGLNTTTGVATVASPTGGTWGIDYSLSDAARIAYTDLVIGATTTQFTSAGNPVGKNLVGNHIRVVSGTGFTAGLYEVVSTSGTTATCDRSLGTSASTGGVGNLGGGHASPGLASASMVSSQAGLLIGPGTYSISSSTAGAAGGPVILRSGSFAQGFCVMGYSSVPGDCASRPILRATTSGVTILTRNAGSADYILIASLDIDGNSQTTSTGINGGRFGEYRALTIRNCTALAFTGATAPNFFYDSLIHSNSGSGYVMSSGLYLKGCVVRNNTTTNAVSAISAVRCLIYSNTGNGLSGGGGIWDQVTSYANSGSGFYPITGSDDICEITNCISYGNTGWAVGGDRNAGQVYINKLAAGSNTAGRIQREYREADSIVLTGDPFVAAGSGNFALNSTSGAGALCRATGYPASYPGGLTTSYADVGAAQTQGSGGGGLLLARGMNGGING